MINNENEFFNNDTSMGQRKILNPRRESSHGLSDTGWAVRPTELREFRGELDHLLG